MKFPMILALVLVVAQAHNNMNWWYETNEAELSSFKKQRAACQWTPKIDASDFFATTSTVLEWGYEVPDWNTHSPDKHIKIQECLFEDEILPHNHWVVRRMGNFKTTGGGVWQNIKYSEAITPRYITGRAFYRYFANNDTVIAYPPIHIHHEHVSRTSNVPQLVPFFQDQDQNRILMQHGDDECLGGENPIDCSGFKTLPEGYSRYPTDIWVYDSVLEDVRPVNSPQIEWYSEIAYRYTVIPQTPVYHFTVATPGYIWHLGLLDIPADKACMWWHTFEFPVDGEFISVWQHNHGVESSFHIKARPEDTIIQKYKKPDRYTVLPLDDLATTKKAIFDDLDEKKIEYCESTPAADKLTYSKDKDYFYGKNFIRRTDFTSCLPWKFKKGDVDIIVGFWDRTDPNTISAPVQHLALVGDYVLENPEDHTDSLIFNNWMMSGDEPGLTYTHIVWGS
eukprot:UN06927